MSHRLFSVHAAAAAGAVGGFRLRRLPALLCLWAALVVSAPLTAAGDVDPGEAPQGIAVILEEEAIRPPASRSEAELLLRRADDAYLDGRYEEAAGCYHSVAIAGFGTPDVLFNLGNANWQADRLGQAVLAWERALLKDPRHDDARANLRLAAERLVDDVAGSVPTPFMERLARRIPTGTVVWGLAAAWLLMVGSLIFRRSAKRRRFLLASGVAAGLLGVMVLGSLSALSIWYHEAVKRAVVVIEVAQVRTGPAPRFDASFEVHEGLVLRVVGYDGPYARVRLDNERGGWVLRRSIALVEP